MGLRGGLRGFFARAVLLLGLGLGSAVAQAGIGLPERLVLLGERIAAAPTDQSLYLRRALIYTDTGEFKLALADIDAAAQFGPVANTHFARAILLHRLGQVQQALPLLTQFIKANPTDAEAVMYRARLLRDVGEREAALADYRRAFALQPDADPGDYLTAARFLFELAQQGRKGHSRRDALAFLDARIQQLGNNAPQLQRYAIEIEQQGCRSAEALARLEQLHPNARRAPLWSLQVAEQHLLLGAREVAGEQLASAKTLLDARRPSAERAQLSHRHDFLHALLALPDQGKARRAALDALYGQHYPATAPAEPAITRTPAPIAPAAATMQWSDFEQADASEGAASHPHAPLAGFESLKPAASRYQPNWAEPVQPLLRCLRQQQSSPR